MMLVKALSTGVVGFALSLLVLILVFPNFGLHTTLAQNLQMDAIFALVNIARSFALRRVLEAIRVR